MAMDAEEVKHSLEEAIGTLKGKLDGSTFPATVSEMLTASRQILQNASDPTKQKIPKGSVPLLAGNDEAKVMFYLVGFEEVDDALQLSRGANLINVRLLEEVLQNAMQRVGVVAQIASGGPLESRVRTYNSSESVESGDPLTVVAHFSYHYFMRWFLFTTQSDSATIMSFGNQIRISMEGIEMATRTLGVMKQDSSAHAAWTALKRDVLQQLEEAQNMSGMENRAALVNSMLGCASELLEELKRSTPPVCITMFFYMHLTKMIMMVTSGGQAMGREDASKYIQTSFDLPMKRFSTTYRESIDKVRNFCLKVQEKELMPEEVVELHELVSWQANEFLEHFTSLSEPSPESGLPRCANAPTLSSMSSQLPLILGDSKSSSSSDTGSFTMTSFPGIVSGSSGGGGGGDQRGSEQLDQTQARDLQMAMRMQMEDMKDQVPPQRAEQLQMMMSHTEAAFEQACATSASTGGSVPSGSTTSGQKLSKFAPTTVMHQTKNMPDYRSLAPTVSNDPDDAALDRDEYNSGGELDVTEKDDCETEKEKKRSKSDEKDVEEVENPAKVTSVPASTTPLKPFQHSPPQQQDVSILPQPRITDTPTQSQHQQQTETVTPLQPQQQPELVRNQVQLQSEPTAGSPEAKGGEREQRRELSKAGQAALARLERLQQQKQPESPKPQQMSVSPKSQRQTPVQGKKEQQSSTRPLRPTQHAGTSAKSSDKQPAKLSSETPQPSHANRVPHSTPPISTPDMPTKQGPTLSQTPVWQSAHIRRPETLSSSSPNMSSSVQPSTKPTDLPQTQRPGSQLTAKAASPQIRVPSTVTPAKPPTQPEQQSNQPLQATPAAASSAALPVSTWLPQTTTTPTASSASGNRVHVTIANSHSRQAVQSRPSAIPDQFRNLTVSQLPRLLQAIKDDADAEEGLKLIKKLREGKEEQLSAKEKEQKVLQEHVVKQKAAVVANALQKTLDKKSDEVKCLQEEMQQLDDARARADEILRSKREVELTELDPEFLYGILEAFLKRIENDHDTMVKVLKAWLDYAPRQVLVEICDKLEIEREGDDPKIWVQKIREREQELEAGSVSN